MNSPITIGYSISETGRFASRAAPWYVNAYGLWAKEVNERGGILGRSVELISYDDGSEPERAAENYRRLIEEDGLRVLLGPCHTVLTPAILPVISENEVLLLQGTHGAASEFEAAGGWHFLCWPGCDADYPRPYLESIAGSKSTAALVYTDGRIGTAVVVGARQYASELGIRIVLDEAIGDEPFDYPGLMARVKASGAEALLIGLDHGRKDEPRASCLRAAAQAVFPSVAIWHSDMPSKADTELGRANEGVHMRITWHPDIQDLRSLTFATAYQAAYGKVPEFHCAGGYACGEVLEQAARAAGAWDADKIRGVLLSQKFETVCGPLRFEPSGRPIGNMRMGVWCADELLIIGDEQHQRRRSA